MTDYIPNDPDCPKCGGLGVILIDAEHPTQFRAHNCHCQHPGVLRALRRTAVAARLGLRPLDPIKDVVGKRLALGRKRSPALCEEERAAAKPITFRDDEGRECRLLVEYGDEIVLPEQRDATPDDLARAGYVQLAEVRVTELLKAIDEAREK